MAAGDRTAVFRAIGDFSRLVRDARKAKREMGGLGDQTKEAAEDLDALGDKADKSASRIVRLSQGAQKLRAKLDDVQRSRFGKWMEDTDKRTRGLITTLAQLATKMAALSLLGVFATAAASPVMGLVGAVVALSGAVGAVPGLVLAGAAAGGVLKVAFMGVVDVMKAAAGTQEEFNEATKNLPPELRQVAKAVRGLMPALRNIRKSIQAKFWDGLEKPLEKVASKYLPMARVQGGRLATTFNKMAHELGGFLSESETVDDVSGSLGNVNKMWQNMIGIVRPLGQVLVDIFAVSSEFLPGMGKGLTDATRRFADFIRQARESGKLKEWIQGGIDQLKALWEVLKNVGRVFGAVFQAGKAEGAGFLETLAEITDKLADFLESDKGQDNLRKMFRAIGDAVDVAIPIMEALFDVVAKILPILVKIGEKIGPGVSAVIRGIGKAVEVAEPHLVRLGQALGDFLKALGSAGPMIGQFVGGLADVLTPIVEALTWLVRTLVDLFESLPPGLQDAVTGFTGMSVVIGLAVIAFGKLLAVGKGVLGMVGKLAAGLNKIPGVNLPVPGKGADAAGAGGKATKAAGAVDLVDDAALAASGDKSGKGFLRSFGAAIKNGAKTVAASFGSLFAGIGSVAKSAGTGVAKAFTWVKPGLASVITNIGKGITALATAFRVLGAALLANPIVLIITTIALIAYLIITNWDTVKVWIGNFFTWVAGIATWLWGQLVTIFNAIVTAVTTAWNAAWKAVSDAITWIVDGVTAGWNAAWKAVSDALTWIVDGVTGAWNAVWKAISDAITWIVDGLTAGWNAAWKAVSDALTWIKDGVGSVFGWIGDAVDTVAGVLGDVFGGAWRTAGDVVSGVIDGIVGAFQWCVDAVTAAVDAIKKALSWIGDAAGNVGSWIGDRLSDINPLNWLAKGGLVGGTGNRDSEAAMLTPGEYVVPKKAAAKWLPWLRAINPYDSGGLQMDLGSMLAGAAGSAPTYGTTSASTSAAGTVNTSGGAVRDVHVTQIVHNPLPEKPSETASKRTGRAARLGVMSAIGGVA